MTTALVISVGTTVEPLLKAIEEAHNEFGAVEVFLLYGRPFPNQSPSPFAVANDIKRQSEDAGLSVYLYEAGDPEDFDLCLREARQAISEAGTVVDQLIVNFTGGTKTLSAALVHAALSELIPAPVFLDYTGGRVRDTQGRVVANAMRVKRAERTRTEEMMDQVYECFQQGHISLAWQLAQYLPESGRPQFVRSLIGALYAWDEYNYGPAAADLRRIAETAKMMTDAPSPASDLVPFVGKLLPAAGFLSDLKSFLEQLSQKNRRYSLSRFLEKTTPEAHRLLVADVLENARRRLREQRPTDAVLRSYRAIEIAVQLMLLNFQVNPWDPDWAAMPAGVVAKFKELSDRTELPSDLALYTGCLLLTAYDRSLAEEKINWLRDIQRTRNRSYLEHGHESVPYNHAQQCVDRSGVICSELLGHDLTPDCQAIRWP